MARNRNEVHLCPAEDKSVVSLSLFLLSFLGQNKEISDIWKQRNILVLVQERETLNPSPSNSCLPECQIIWLFTWPFCRIPPYNPLKSEGHFFGSEWQPGVLEPGLQPVSTAGKSPWKEGQNKGGSGARGWTYSHVRWMPCRDGVTT